MLFAPRSAVEPCWTSIFMMLKMLFGSPACTMTAVPSTWARPCRSPLAAATSWQGRDPLGEAGVDAAGQSATGVEHDVAGEALVDGDR